MIAPSLLLTLALAAEGPVLQPDARDEAAPDRRFDLLRLQLDLALDPGARSVAGTARFQAVRLAPGPLVLDQVALQFERVTCGGAEVPWRTVGDTLVVDVPEGQRGAEVEVAVSYSATPRNGLHFRQPGRGSPDAYPEVWSQGEGNDNRYWFPGWDHPNDRFLYEGHITAPDGYEVLTNSGMNVVNYLVMVAAGPYEVHEQGEASVWVPPGTPEEQWRPVLDPVPGMLAHFAERTATPYPWGPYRQVFVQRFLYTGMENTSATVMDAKLLVPLGNGSPDLGTESVVAHELAHQWYGDWLTCRTWRELWLNEGFATFMAADWMETVHGEDYYAASVLGWFDASKQPDVMARRFHQGDGPAAAQQYVKGASTLQMLRVMLGEETFWAGIRRYTTDHADQLVETHDLRHAMEEVSGMELGWFFQQWTELAHVPGLDVTQRYADGELVVTVRQGTEAPLFTLPVQIEVGTAEGPRRVEAWLVDEDVELHLPLSLPPTYVAFDPDGGLLMSFDHEQSDAAWAAQLDSPSPVARLRAIDGLVPSSSSAPLAAVLADPARSIDQRTRAARVLGQQRAMEPLLAAAADPEPQVREVVAQALGQSPDAEPVEVLTRLFNSDPVPSVRANALRSLAGLDPERGRRLAAKAIGVRGRVDTPLRQAAIDVLGQHGELSDLRLLLDPGLDQPRRMDALWAAVRVAERQEGGARDKAREQVARSAEPLLDDLNLRARQSAIGVLGRVGDDRSVQLLERYARVETVSELSEAAWTAVRDIGARSDAPAPTPGEAEARLKALEDRLDALEKEMEQVRDRH